MSLKKTTQFDKLIAKSKQQITILEEKRQALKAEIARKGLIAEEKVITYILNHTSRGLSDLLQLISDLDGFSLERKRRITIPLVKEMISFDQTV